MSLPILLSERAAFIATLDLAQPSATDALNARFPYAEESAFREALLAAHAEGSLTPRQAGPGIRFGRVAKPSAELSGHSVDAVDIEGAGAEHTHPKGEVSFCIPTSGTPSFEGAQRGWVVLPPGSHHTPTVEGGRMLIVYFLPEGALTWGPRVEA